MDKMRKIVEEKREKCSEKKPRFGMRKLSVGLVSCVLGYLTFVSPQTVIAETNVNDNIIVSTASEVEKNKKSKEVETLYFDEIFKPELKSFNNVSVEDASAFASENSEKLYNVDENVSAAEESRKPNESKETNESIENPESLLSNELKPTETSETKKDLFDLFDKEKIAENAAEMLKKVEEKPAEEAKNKTESNNVEEENTSDDKKLLEVKPETTPDYVNAVEGETSVTNESEKNEKPAKPEYKESDIVEDEKNIKSYRQSEIAGAGRQIKVTDENIGEEKEGVRVETLQPSSDSNDKKSFGVEVNIDKTKSDRTYNGFLITDSVRGVKVDGKGEFLDPGQTLPTNTEDTVTYKPDSQGDEISTGRQTGFDYNSTEKDNKHLANKDTGKVTIAWKGKYNAHNPNNKLLQGGNFEVSVGVNPYPNENKALSLIELEGKTTISKAPVKNQYIVSEAKIINAGEEDYTRLIGEVYHPNEDILVNGAKALIVNASNIEELRTATGNTELAIGQIVFKMPEGALENKDSIFNDDKFKGVQNLRAKFYARPRTAEEFKALADELRGNYGPYSYQSTGAGTRVINHNGKEVTIDKQGIARYDHYNLIGEMTINLDDTKYYDQSFKDGNGQDTEKHISSKVMAGESLEINMYEPEGDKRKENQKSAAEMNEAKKDGKATGVVKEDFVETENKRIAEKLGKTVEELTDDQKWVINTDKGDLSKFTITPPKSAKAGDFIAVPVEYTYTNGSKDVHWFHFVVQDSDNNKPEYKAEAGFQGETLNKTPDLSTKEEDLKKNQPTSYELKPGVYKDDKGNVWATVKKDPETGEITADNVSINSETGEVSVKVPEGVDIIGGENLYVPIIAKYEIKDDQGSVTKTKTEEVSAQFIARPKHEAKGGHAIIEKIPFETKVIYDETLDVGVVKETKGELGSKRTVYEWDFDSTRKNADGTEDRPVLVNTTETVIKEKKDAEIRIGVRPVEEKVVIPHTIEYIVDPSLKPGEEVMEEEGLDGEITIKTTRDPETGKISITKEETLPMQPMKVKVGTYGHENKIPFDTTIQFDDNLPAGTKGTVTEGVVGKTETKVTPAKIADMDDMMKTIGEGNFRDENNTPNYNAIANYMVDKGFWDADKITKTTDETGKVTEAKYGDKTFEELLMFDEKNNPQGKAVVPGKVETKEVTPKKDKVIKVGTKTTGTVVDTDEIPFKVKVEKDQSLKKGEWKYKKDENGEDLSGKVGTNKKTWTIVNSQIVGEPVLEETKPVDAVILVGDENFTGNVTHDVEEKIPFKVQVIEDPTMDKGKTEVVQTGVEGTKTTTYTQAIENGTAKGDMTTTVKSTTEAKDHIIKVGTKPLTGSANVETKNQKPFDVEIEYDNTKPAGTVEIVEGTGVPGEETKTTPVTSEDGTVTPGETTTKEDKAPINKKIIVGTQGYNGEFKHEYTNIIPFETEVEIDPTLAPNEVKEVQAGVNGETKTTVTQTITNGVAGDKQVSDPVKTKDPVNRKIKVGAKTNGTFTDKEKIPFEITVEKDPSLKKGEWKYKEVDGVKQTGVVGEKERTITIENSKVTNESDYTTTKPAENAVILVGEEDFTGNVTHTDKKEIPFEVEIVENPNLAVGTKNVKQQGEAGEKEVTYTQAIKNGQAEGNVTSTEKETKAPKKHIIEVGTKAPDKVTSSTGYDIPYETEIVYNPDKPLGTTTVLQEGKNGRVEDGVETVYDPETNTLINNKTGKEIKAQKRVVEIGTKAPDKVTSSKGYDIPYETEIIYNPDKPIGTVNVLQEGKNGRVEDGVETVYDPETNTLINNKTGKEIKAQKRVIEIGTKNICPLPEKPNPNPDPGTETPDRPIDPIPDNPDPGTPEHPNPSTPSTPGDNTPENPGGGDIPKDNPTESPKSEDSGNPGENNSVESKENHPSDTVEETPNDSKSNDSTNNSNVDNVENVDKVDIAESNNEKVNKNESTNTLGDNFAPQTSDYGIAGYAGIGAAAAIALAFLEAEKKKRK